MQKSDSQQLLGLIFVVCSAMADSTLPIFGKLAYANGLDPAVLLMLRNGFSFLILFGYLFIFNGRQALVISKASLGQGLVLIASEMAYLYSLKEVAANVATVIFYTYPILVAVLAATFFKERLSKAIVAGLALALSGIVLLSGVFGHSLAISPLGFLLDLLASTLFATFCLIGHKNVHRAGPLQLAATFSLVGMVVMGVLFPTHLLEIVSLNRAQLLIGLGTAICNNLFGIIFFLMALKKIGASKAALGCTLEPVLTLLLAFLVLGELLSTAEAVGVSLIIGSIILTFPRTQGQAGKVSP
jgi:drug/metabolite transporter (DMT)-like permease